MKEVEACALAVEEAASCHVPNVADEFRVFFIKLPHFCMKMNGARFFSPISCLWYSGYSLALTVNWGGCFILGSKIETNRHTILAD